MSKVFAGTSGWSHPQFKPEFYPPSVKPGFWLPFYAGHLPTVEVNNSFYRPPAPQMIAKWKTSVPDNFRFAVKAWQQITHDKKLKNCGQEIAMFHEVMKAFGETLGPVLFQLPPSLREDEKLLADFIAQLPSGYKYTIEFRHLSWHKDSVYQLLKENNIALCMAHLKSWDAEVFTADFAYMRLHGPQKIYEGNYSDEFLAALAAKIKASGVSESYVYFNNTKDSSVAPFNALKLMQMANL